MTTLVNCLKRKQKANLHFSIVQKQTPARETTFDGEIGTPMFESARWSLPSLDPADVEDKVSISVEMSSVVYTHSSTFLAELNSCAADFKRCMATLAQSITAAATDLALGIVQRRSDIREGTPARSGMQESGEVVKLYHLQTKAGHPSACGQCNHRRSHLPNPFPQPSVRDTVP